MFTKKKNTIYEEEFYFNSQKNKSVLFFVQKKYMDKPTNEGTIPWQYFALGAVGVGGLALIGVTGYYLATYKVK